MLLHGSAPAHGAMRRRINPHGVYYGCLWDFIWWCTPFTDGLVSLKHIFLYVEQNMLLF